ncbi:MAG: DUF4055 domain-containing protein [Culicoidibacterales bacterium]
MTIKTQHSDYINSFYSWKKIEDVLEGEDAVKNAKTLYLPKPNASDISPENEERYKAYINRAVLHNASARTVDNMVGQCFSNPPIPTVPDQILNLLDNIDGAGTSLEQQSKKALSNIISFSRSCLWIDYPKTDGAVTMAQAESGGIRPRIVNYSPTDVINWRTISEGASVKLSLVVIKETYDKEDDGFKCEIGIQYRVLRLIDGFYFYELYKQNEQSAIFEIVEASFPLGGDGRKLKEIPFIFIGAISNNFKVEKPLMLDIVNLNLSHYRNSADFEESVYMNSQGTAYITGLNDEWVDRHFPKGISLGARTSLMLPQGCSVGALEFNVNNLAKEAMDQKEKLMEALGARLVEKSSVQKTATEAGIKESSETSILAACCNNVSAAYGKALEWCAMFMNIPFVKGGILYELNTDFSISTLSPQEGDLILKLYSAGLISFEEARDKLKRGGIGFMLDEDVKDQIETNTNLV